MTDQDRIFATSEGDRWFRRNVAALERFDPATDLPMRLLALYDLRPRRVVEVGASNGTRLAVIRARYGSEVVAVEPSAAAAEDGRSRHGGVKFVRATADALPFRVVFDVVIVNFVFHWIDRANLLRAMSEIDHVLVDGGFLIIGDFRPFGNQRVRYHHLPDEEVFTYKQDYAAVFTGSGLYQPVCSLTADHASGDLLPAVDGHHRIGVALLRKRLTSYYADR